MLGAHGAAPFSEGGITVAVLDAFRLLNVIGAISLAVILFYRSSRWIKRFREPAYLHLSAAVMCMVVAINAFTYLGHGLTRFFVWNVAGVLLGWLFVIKTPMEKNYSWKEQRGGPPDWNDLVRRHNPDWG